MNCKDRDTKSTLLEVVTATTSSEDGGLTVRHNSSWVFGSALNMINRTGSNNELILTGEHKGGLMKLSFNDFTFGSAIGLTIEFSGKDYSGVIIQMKEPGYADVWIEADSIKLTVAKPLAGRCYISIKQVCSSNNSQLPHLKPKLFNARLVVYPGYFDYLGKRIDKRDIISPILTECYAAKREWKKHSDHRLLSFYPSLDLFSGRAEKVAVELSLF